MHRLHALLLLTTTATLLGCPNDTQVRNCEANGDCADGAICAEGTCQQLNCPVRFRDDDGDGFGAVGSGAETCADAPDAALRVENDDDCDDTAADVHPGGAEDVADGVDGDCDGFESCFEDADNDGVGVEGALVEVALVNGDCLSAPGAAVVAGDCDDADAARSPANLEVPATGIDEDCDGGEVCFADGDGDGFGPLDLTAATVPSADFDCDDPGEIAVGGDCDDAAPEVRPGAVEGVADGIDQDCDGGELCFVDADDDDHGAGTGETAAVAGVDCAGALNRAPVDDDCDDASAVTFPGAPELPGSGVDEDCDGSELCFVDGDGDGFGSSDFTQASATLTCAVAGLSAAGGDCADDDPDLSPGAVDVVADGTDQNCDGVDSCLADADGDGFGADGVVVAGDDLDCADGPGTSALGGDCNDASAAAFPGGTESVADEVDGDCDGSEVCFVDGDGDGFGDPALTDDVTGTECDVPGSSSSGADCNDADGAISPAGAEVGADGLDQDCDGVDSCFVDADGDGFAGTGLVDDDDLDCADGTGPGFAVSGDCEDANANAFPGGVEQVADGSDGNCDGDELCFVDVDGDELGDPAAPPVLIADSLDCRAGVGAADNDRDCDDSVAGGVGTACSDGLACTAGDLCNAAGECVGFDEGACGCSPGAAQCDEAGGCCDHSCGGGDCPDCVGAQCRFDCTGAVSCTATCSAGAVCEIPDGGGVSSSFTCVDATCRYGGNSGTSADYECTASTCVYDVDAGTSLDAVCSGSFCAGSLSAGTSAGFACEDGSDCDVACDAPGGCDVRCDASSSALFRCAQQACDVTCVGSETSCGGGVTACNRACP